MHLAQHLLIICTVWPEPKSSAAGLRMLQLIHVFKDNGYNITLACDAKQSAYSFDFSQYSINQIEIELNNSAFDEQLKQLMPTCVMFDRFMTEEKYGWRVTENCPKALKILDTEDLHCLRKSREDALKKHLIFNNTLLINDVSKREIASIYRCDVSLIISSFEMDLLQTFFKIDKSLLYYLPFLLDPITELDKHKWPAFANREHFVMIGNFLHEPNTNSVFFMKEKIWPLIKKQLPNAELHVYGAYANEKVNNLNDIKQGFLIKGRAENSQTVILNAKVLLAPLRFGAGVKGKLTEAMQCGTPTVTTTIGAEGMHDGYEWNGFIADEELQIANNAVELYTNESLWMQAQANGIEIINNIYSKQLYQEKFIADIFKLQQNLSAHREQNFIGAMLTHHTMASTKFMSKWIELKNT